VLDWFEESDDEDDESCVASNSECIDSIVNDATDAMVRSLAPVSSGSSFNRAARRLTAFHGGKNVDHHRHHHHASSSNAITKDIRTRTHKAMSRLHDRIETGNGIRWTLFAQTMTTSDDNADNGNDR
jgi:hypothetical protein